MPKTIKTAKCQNEGCDGIVYYTTKPRKYCEKCRKEKKKAPKGNGKSKLENTAFKMLSETIKGEYINNGYYSWLISPKGMPMQLDRYYPEYKLAFEIQGIQHFSYQSYYHRSKAEFEYLQKCDSLKGLICSKRNTTLIHLNYNERITKELILKKIHSKNPKLYNQLLKDKLLNTMV